MGDPIFGKNNKNAEGLKLISYCLEFIDPHTKKRVKVELSKDRLLF